MISREKAAAVVAGWPPLSDHQRAVLAVLLRPAADVRSIHNPNNRRQQDTWTEVRRAA